MTRARVILQQLSGAQLIVKPALLIMILLAIVFGDQYPVYFTYGQVLAVLGLAFLFSMKLLTLYVASDSGAPYARRDKLILLADPVFLGALVIWAFFIRHTL